MGGKPAPMLADYAALIDGGVVYVLTDGGSVAGVVVMEPVEGVMFLENVAVSPPYQGLGLGRELMRFVEETARGSGLRGIHLYTNELMTENIAFYGRLGFQETDRRLDGGYRRVFMSKEIAEETRKNPE